MLRLISIALGAAFILFGAGSVQAETVLRITLQLPIKSSLGQNLVAFKKEVETASKGDIKIEIYPSAQLYKDKAVPQAVSSGAIEMGTASITRFAGTIPAVDIFYVPFMFNDWDAVAKATAPGGPVRGPIDEAILETGARPLWWQAFGFAIMLSKDKPLRRPEDIKGLKVRVFGKTLGEFIKAVGAVPTLMSGSEQFLAYQRGTVDAGMTAINAVKSRKLYEVMDYLTVTNHADVEFVVLINEKTWQGLSQGQRDILTAAARKVETALRAQYAKIDADALDFIANKTKMKVVRISDADRAAWRAATRSVVDTYIEKAGPLGKKLVAAARALQ